MLLQKCAQNENFDMKLTACPVKGQVETSNLQNGRIRILLKMIPKHW